MKLRAPLCILLVSITLGPGCSPRADQLSNDDALAIVSSFRYEQEARDAIVNAKVSCLSPSQCHPAIALVTGWKVDRNEPSQFAVFQCTGVLLNETTLLTNSHCIPNLLKIPGAKCAGQMHFSFPAFGTYPPAKAGCAKIVQPSRIYVDYKYLLSRPDVSIVELDTPIEGRKPLDVSRDGLVDQAAVTVYKVDPLSRFLGGTLTQSTCKVQYQLPEDRAFDQPLSRLGLLNNCSTPLIPGNSGSPVVDSSGKAVAIFQGAQLTRKGNKDTGVYRITNLACVNGIPGVADSDAVKSCKISSLDWENGTN